MCKYNINWLPLFHNVSFKTNNKSVQYFTVMYLLQEPISARQIFFEFFDESSFRGALWDLIRKSKISSHYLYTLPRYGHFKIFCFIKSATLIWNQLFSNLNWLKLRTSKLRTVGIFWNISTRSRVISERRHFVFNSVRIFLDFLQKKYAKNGLIKIL